MKKLGLLLLILVAGIGGWLLNNKMKRAAVRHVYYMDHRTAWIVAHATADYAAAHGNRLPDYAEWEDEIRPYWQKFASEPLDVKLSPRPNGVPRRLCFNRTVSGFDISKWGDREAGSIVIYFEANTATKNASGDWSPGDAGPDQSRMAPLGVYLDGHTYEAEPIPLPVNERKAVESITSQGASKSRGNTMTLINGHVAFQTQREGAK
ncbi:MAG TPA: hypothetical protein VGK19_10195 [Capsulimonadaceae bacterium]